MKLEGKSLKGDLHSTPWWMVFLWHGAYPKLL